MERALAVPNRQDDDCLDEEDHRLPERDHREEGKVGKIFLRIRIRHHVLGGRDAVIIVNGERVQKGFYFSKLRTDETIYLTIGVTNPDRRRQFDAPTDIRTNYRQNGRNSLSGWRDGQNLICKLYRDEVP